ncbi:MAG: rhomboid family intramembrane serine protease [Bacteroidota bacterium]
MSISRDIRMPFLYGNVIVQIIIVNAVIFLAVNIYRFILFASGFHGDALEGKFLEFSQWLMMPLDFNEFIYKPWTIITYMFTHTGIGHIFWNMVFLLFFGKIFQDFSGSKRVLAIYVYGALIGAVLQMLAVNFIPALQPGINMPMLGASAGVMALVIASAALVPDFEVNLILIGRVKLKYIALFYVFMDFIGITYMGNTAHFAHLGGALFGFLFVIQLRKGRDLSKNFNKVFQFIKNPLRRKNKMKVAYSSVNKRAVNDDKYNENKINKQKRVDDLLDKIGKSGYESLSKEEKDFLFKASKDV